MSGRTVSPRAYLVIATSTGIIAFAAVWLWVALMPLAYLDPEYPAWLAKHEMLVSCDLGNVLIVGDSRAATDILPALMPMRSVNLAVGGGEPIEAYVAIRRALACPALPERVVVSFEAGHFMLPDLFWERSVRYGFLDRDDIADLARVSHRLGDGSIYRAGHGDGLPESLRGALYLARFPPLYFASLAKGGIFLRWRKNADALAAALAARGQYYFGVAPGSNSVALDGHLDRFTPLPVLDAYFDRMLALLAARGIQVEFIAMPVNGETRLASRLALRHGFAAYLRRYEGKYSNFHVLGPVMPSWPDRLFGDEYSHLNPAGARLFSRRFAACLAEKGACLLDWDPPGQSAGVEGGRVGTHTSSDSEERTGWPRSPGNKSLASITAVSATSW
jgi:hypothetical protein